MKKKASGAKPGEIMTAHGAAEYLNCNYVTIYRMLRAGELPAFRLGSGWRFQRADLDPWIDARTVVVEDEAERTQSRRGRKGKSRLKAAHLQGEIKTNPR